MRALQKAWLVLTTVGVLLMIVSPALAQVDEKKHQQDVEKVRAEADKYKAPFGGPSFGAGLGAGLAIIGAALGFGRIGAAALESMARQPETAARIQTAMLIIAALLEGATFFALIICIILAGK